jgi:hypothetical protein
MKRKKKFSKNFRKIQTDSEIKLNSEQDFDKNLKIQMYYKDSKIIPPNFPIIE